MTGGRGQPTRRPAWPTTQTVESALRTGVLGSACAQRRSAAPPGSGRQQAGWGSLPPGASGSRLRDPCTSSSGPAVGERRLRAVETGWMHGLLAARVAVGLERRRGGSCRRYYLNSSGVGRCGPRGRCRLPSASRGGLPAGSQPMRGGRHRNYKQCDSLVVWPRRRAVTRTSADSTPGPAARPAGSGPAQRRPHARVDSTASSQWLGCSAALC